MTTHMLQHFADVALGTAAGATLSSSISERSWFKFVQGLIFLAIAFLPW